jgi:hypothetical protein
MNNNKFVDSLPLPDVVPTNKTQSENNISMLEKANNAVREEIKGWIGVIKSLGDIIDKMPNGESKNMMNESLNNSHANMKQSVSKLSAIEKEKAEAIQYMKDNFE